MYEWIKALHIIAVISWMAGLLYLPRLFVYHADKVAGSEASEMLKIMERKLLKYITTPAMVVVFLSGAGLWYLTDPMQSGAAGWFHTKLLLVAALAGFHGCCAKWRKAFERDGNTHPAKFYRIANEIPTLLMVGIVILVVVRPF